MRSVIKEMMLMMICHSSLKQLRPTVCMRRVTTSSRGLGSAVGERLT